MTINLKTDMNSNGIQIAGNVLEDECKPIKILISSNILADLRVPKV